MFYIKDDYTIRMFNIIIIITLLCNVIFLFINTLSQDMFIVYFLFIYICIFKFYYLYVCTFMVIGNTSLMLLSINMISVSHNEHLQIFHC